MIILIQIIKWMPPYRFNKALHTPTQYFIFNFWLFASFEMSLRCDKRFEKGEKKSWAKGGFEPESIALNRPRHTLYHLCHWS